MGSLGVQLGEDRLAPAVAEDVVLVMEPERRREDRVVADEPAEAGLDELEQGGVEWSRDGRGRAREGSALGFGQAGRLHVVVDAVPSGSAVRAQAVAPTAVGAGRLGAVSARASRVARMTVSMSVAWTSWWVAARI